MSFVCLGLRLCVFVCVGGKRVYVDSFSGTGDLIKVRGPIDGVRVFMHVCGGLSVCVCVVEVPSATKQTIYCDMAKAVVRRKVGTEGPGIGFEIFL